MQTHMSMLTRRALVVRVSLAKKEQVGFLQLQIKAAKARLQNWDSSNRVKKYIILHSLLLQNWGC